MTRFRQFGAITKVEDQDDGTIKVWGVASSETRDQQGETITAAAMKAALPDYGRFPALREMHEPSAAGRVVEADVDDHGITQICAHVVDPLAITKVRAGVYAGFSIGGKVLKRDTADRSVITALKLVEISLVDSPCNPDAVINMWKADMDYVPSGDEVVAKARELAEDAGSRRYKDFLFKARERLIAAALASELGDDEDDQDEDRDPDAGADADPPATDPDGGEPDDQDKQPPAKPGARPAAGEQASARPKPGARPAAKPQPKPESADPQADTDADTGDSDAQPNGDAPADADDDAPPPKSKTKPAPDSKDRVKRVATGDADNDADDADADDAGAGQADADRVQAAHDHLVALGALCCKKNCGDADQPSADAAGRPRPHAAPPVPDPDEDTEKLRRGGGLGDAMMADLAKRFGETITMLNATIGDLTKRLERVEAEPAAPRTAAGPLRAVTKTEDASPNSANAVSAVSADELKKVIDTLPEQERGQFLLRIALSNPTLVHAARAAA